MDCAVEKELSDRKHNIERIFIVNFGFVMGNVDEDENKTEFFTLNSAFCIRVVSSLLSVFFVSSQLFLFRTIGTHIYIHFFYR